MCSHPVNKGYQTVIPVKEKTSVVACLLLPVI
jgi:hypothetical protein